MSDVPIRASSNKEKQAINKKLKSRYKVEVAEYNYQKETYERKRKIFEDNMQIWNNFNQTAKEMDARFDKALFTIAAGSFGLSFAFIDRLIPLADAIYSGLLVSAWACFTGCLVVMVLGHLLSSVIYYKQCNEVTQNMVLAYEGKPYKTIIHKDFVSYCNYAAFIVCVGGVVCLLLFVLLNL